MKLSLFSYGTALAALLVSPLAAAQEATTTQQSTTTTTTAPAPVQPAPAPVVAQTTTTSAPVFVQPTVQHEEVTKEEGYAPNSTLLVSGIVVFGIPYIASLGVATESDHAGDHHLFVPVAGPWLDFANRGSCSTGQTACDNETTNKVLLAVDGVFQAIGVIEVVSAFLSPEKREVTTVPATAYTPKMTLTPAKVGGTGYGLAALARW